MTPILASTRWKMLAAAAALAPAMTLSAQTVHFSEDFESYGIAGSGSVTLPTSGDWTYNAQDPTDYSVVDSSVQAPSSTGGNQVLRFVRTGALETDPTLKSVLETGLTLEAGMAVQLSFEAMRPTGRDGVFFTLSGTSFTRYASRVDFPPSSGGTIRYGDGGNDVTQYNVMDNDIWHRFDIVVHVSEGDEPTITYDVAITPDGGEQEVIAEGISVSPTLGVGEAMRVYITPRSNNTEMFFDNITVTSGAIPEPASLSLLGLGAVVMFRRR